MQFRAFEWIVANTDRLAQKRAAVQRLRRRSDREIFERFLESVRRYGSTYGLGCTQTSTEIPFDELILKMMRTAGAIR